jgi:orotate phosphoribosyltransferase
MSRRNELLALLAARSAKRGTFTLASGRQSSLYIDARITTMSPEGLSLIGPLGLEAIEARGWKVDAVGGLTLGADPIACAVSYAARAS